MKKQLIVIFTLVIISIISFTSCEPFIENKIVARNLAAADVQLNIRGQIHSVPAGQTIVLNDFKKEHLNMKQFMQFLWVLRTLVQMEMLPAN